MAMTHLMIATQPKYIFKWRSSPVRAVQPRLPTAIGAASLPHLERVNEETMNLITAPASQPGGFKTTGELASPSLHFPAHTTKKAASSLSHPFFLVPLAHKRTLDVLEAKIQESIFSTTRKGLGWNGIQQVNPQGQYWKFTPLCHC